MFKIILEEIFFQIENFYLPILIIFGKIFFLSSISTAIIETFYFYINEYKNKNFICLVFIINIFTNFLLNCILILLSNKKIIFIIGEIIVVYLEYIIYKLFLKNSSTDDRKKLFKTNLIANIITIFTGIFIELIISLKDKIF